MNCLPHEKQVAVISALTEGLGVRATERLTGVHRDSCLRLLVRVGDACASMQDQAMQKLTCARIQLDEQWTFVERKQRHLQAGQSSARCGDFWLWSCIDEESRAIPAYHLGKRKRADAEAFVLDVAKRIENRVTISADGFPLYVEAIHTYFGGRCDFGQIVKSFEAEQIGPGRYSPPRVTSVERKAVIGSPNVDAISTSYIERLHLLNRMRIRRMTRLCDGFSRKLENLRAAVSVHYAVYNFVKPHKSLLGSTPAQALGVASREWTMSELVELAQW